MTVQRALTQWMVDNGFGTYGTDLFIGTAPEQAPAKCWWILGGGGSPILRNQTGEKTKAYIFSVFYRNTDAEDVDQRMQELEEQANSRDCHDIQDYETVSLEASGFQSDRDLDPEDRVIGSVEVTVTVYQSE